MPQLLLTNHQLASERENVGKIKVSDEKLFESLYNHDSIGQTLIHVRLTVKEKNYARYYKLLSKHRI